MGESICQPSQHVQPQPPTQEQDSLRTYPKNRSREHHRFGWGGGFGVSSSLGHHLMTQGLGSSLHEGFPSFSTAGTTSSLSPGAVGAARLNPSPWVGTAQNHVRMGLAFQENCRWWGALSHKTKGCGEPSLLNSSRKFIFHVLLLLRPRSSFSWWCVGVCEGFILSPLNHCSITSFQPFCTCRKEPHGISPCFPAEGDSQRAWLYPSSRMGSSTTPRAPAVAHLGEQTHPSCQLAPQNQAKRLPDPNYHSNEHLCLNWGPLEDVSPPCLNLVFAFY